MNDDRRDRLGFLAARSVINPNIKQYYTEAEMQRAMDEVMEELRVIDEGRDKVAPIIIGPHPEYLPMENFHTVQFVTKPKPGKNKGPRNMNDGIPRRRKKGR